MSKSIPVIPAKAGIQINNDLVPKLRFPEFRGAEEWKFTPLKKLAKRCSEKNREGRVVRVLTNSAEFGVIDQRDYFDKDIAIQGNLESYSIVEKGDFVYNPRISSMAPVGPISKNNIATGVMSPLYTVFRFNFENDDFYAHFFKTTGWHQYMRQVSSTGARHDRMAIAKNDFISMPVPTSPAKEEQQKIADCLSSLDELITAHTQNHQVLQTYKKGLMQNLFPSEGETVPALRFPEFEGAGEWELKSFSSFIKLYRGSSPRPIKEYLTKSEHGVNWIKIGDTDLKSGFFIKTVSEKITPAGAKKSRKVNKGELILANSMSYGKTYQLGLGGCIYDGWFVLREYERVFDKQFLLQLLNSTYMQEQYKKLAAGGIVQNISSQIVYSTLLPKPPIEEQQKIANCLSSVDELITAQAQKINSLKAHKKGLMQQLFPSTEAGKP